MVPLGDSFGGSPRSNYRLDKETHEIGIRTIFELFIMHISSSLPRHETMTHNNQHDATLDGSIFSGLQRMNAVLLERILAKRVLFIIVGLCICSPCFSQLSQTERNEVKVNVAMTLIKYPEISYERFLGNRLGAGLSVGIPLKRNDWDMRFLILPYGRFYFWESDEEGAIQWRQRSYIHGTLTDRSFPHTVSCLFVEINAGIYGKNEDSDIITSRHTATKFGLGFAIGYKILRQYSMLTNLDGRRRFADDHSLSLLDGISAEMFLGLGWGVDDFKTIAYPRVGLSIGKKF